MSTLHTYFRPEIKNSPGFKVVTVKSKTPDDKTEFCEMQVFQKGAEWYTMDLDLEHEIPEAASPFISRFSYHECFPLNPKRETGVYTQEGTEAELSVNNSNYFVQLRGVGREQIKRLLRAIRAGTIRPTESWEGQQTGCSKAELEQKLAQSEAARTDLSSDLADRTTRLSVAETALLRSEETRQDLALRLGNALDELQKARSVTQ